MIGQPIICTVLYRLYLCPVLMSCLICRLYLPGDAWTIPTAGAIMVALVAGVFPSKLGRPLISFVAQPAASLPSSTCTLMPTGEEDAESSEAEPESHTSAVGAHVSNSTGARFQASFVETSDASCDLCGKAFLQNQCEVFWSRKNQHGDVYFHVHAECFPTVCCQEGAETETIDLVCHQQDSVQDPKLRSVLDSILLDLSESFE